MSWEQFVYFAIASVLLWAAGAYTAWKDKRTAAVAFTVSGLVLFFLFIVLFWISLERPPLRTMGETRLWYSFFLSLAGLIIYSRWRYKWILSFSTVMSLVFICINLFKPEIHSKTLMPALQSPWFAPHVIVYMFAYALLGASFLISVFLLFKGGKTTPTAMRSSLSAVDDLVYAGLAFMTFGMLFGALWAKEAWGHYWSWDPKETWAAITWFSYLVFVHYRLYRPQSVRPALWVLIVSFLLLQMCWWGINYLPSAQGTSVHTYTSFFSAPDAPEAKSVFRFSALFKMV